MKILRETEIYSLNKGTLQAEGLYNVINKSTNEVSLWFDTHELEYSRLLHSTNQEFNSICESYLEI